MNTKTSSISDLCDHSAWEKGSFLWLIYLPIGMIVALIRLLFIALVSLTSWALPTAFKRPLFRLLIRVLGIQVRYNLSESEIGAYTEGCVVAANHVAVFDPFTVLSLPHATIMVGNPLRKTNILSILAHFSAFQCSGAKFWPVTEKKEFVRRITHWRSHPQGVTLYTTPEMTINNGNGLFKFNPTFVCLGMPVIPAAVKLVTPLGLNPHPIGSSGAAIFFRLLMIPYLRYEITYLDRQEREPGETKENFCTRIQHAIAQHLNIVPSRWTVQDKHAYRAKLKHGR